MENINVPLLVLQHVSDKEKGLRECECVVAYSRVIWEIPAVKRELSLTEQHDVHTNSHTAHPVLHFTVSDWC